MTMHAFRLTRAEATANPLVSANALGEFFTANVTPAYISHGEVFCGRAQSLTEWVPNLVEVVAQEVTDALTVDMDTKQVWVALDGESLVGLAIVSIQSERVATFDDMVVVQGGRSKGYGEQFYRALLVGLKAELPALEVGMCESGLHNEGAHRFIERLGFEAVSKVFSYTFTS